MKNKIIGILILATIMLALTISLATAIVSPASNLNGYGQFTISDYKTISIIDNATINGSLVCTATNGICGAGSGGVTIDQSVNKSSNVTHYSINISGGNIYQDNGFGYYAKNSTGEYVPVVSSNTLDEIVVDGGAIKIGDDKIVINLSWDKGAQTQLLMTRNVSVNSKGLLKYGNASGIQNALLFSQVGTELSHGILSTQHLYLWATSGSRDIYLGTASTVSASQAAIDISTTNIRFNSTSVFEKNATINGNVTIKSLSGGAGNGHICITSTGLLYRNTTASC